MRKTVLTLFIIWIGFFCLTSGKIQGMAAENFVDEFPETAFSSVSVGLAGFLEKIPKGGSSEYGFTNEAELQQATLGTPFLLYVIKPEIILSYQSGMMVDQMLEGTGQWFFPVMVNQNIKAMLIVEERMDGSFEAVSFGYVRLATQLNRLSANDNWKDLKACKLVVIFQAKEFFLAKPKVEPQRLFPLQFDDTSRQKPNDDLYFNIERVRAIVETNVNEEPEHENRTK